MKRKKAKSNNLRAVKVPTPPSVGFERITFDPRVMGGQACIRGMRLPVSLLVNLVANGMTRKDILQEYPDLEAEDITEALQYAAWLAREEVHSITG